jgi:hypothetical protein
MAVQVKRKAQNPQRGEMMMILIPNRTKKRVKKKLRDK